MNRTMMNTNQSLEQNPSKARNSIRGYEQVDIPIEVLDSAIFQRPIVEKNVRPIVEKFDTRKVQPLSVSFRDGQYYIFDGAHTLRAIKEKYGEENVDVPCRLYTGLTLEEEAELFATQYDNCTQVPFLYRLNANSIANKTDYAAFRSITEEEGFILSEKGRVGDYTIGAVKKAWDIYSNNGPILYRTVLRLVKRTWAGKSWSLEGRVLGGVAAFVKTYPNFNEERFVRNLCGSDMNQLTVGSAGITKKKDIPFAFAIAKLYNTRAGKNAVNVNLLLV